jgi:hypothetical protein
MFQQPAHQSFMPQSNRPFLGPNNIIGVSTRYSFTSVFFLHNIINIVVFAASQPASHPASPPAGQQ